MPIRKSPDQIEHKKNYQQHLERVKQAHCEIDDGSPDINTTSFAFKFQNDVQTVLEHLKHNFTILAAIMKKNFVGGDVNSFRQPTQLPGMSRWKAYQEVQRELEKDNQRIGNRLIQAKPIVCTGLSEQMRRNNKQYISVKDGIDKKLQHLLKKLQIKLPREPKILKSIMRPQIYFDVKIGLSPRTERFVIQLYLEAAPQVVRDLVIMCQNREHKKFNILRLFVDLWIEFELRLNENALSTSPLEYDDKVLNIKQAGLLLYHRMFLQGFTAGRINFVICVRSMKVLRETHVPFGRIVSNLSFINRLQDFGTRRGHPKKQLIVANCGVLK